MQNKHNAGCHTDVFHMVYNTNTAGRIKDTYTRSEERSVKEMPCINNVEHYNAKEPTGAEPCCPADVTREDMNESSYKDNLNVTFPTK